MKCNYELDILEITKEEKNECRAVKQIKMFSGSNDDEVIKEVDKALKAFKYLNAILYRISYDETKRKVAWWSDGKIQSS